MLNSAEATLGVSKAVPLARQFLTTRYSELSVPVSPVGYHQAHDSLNFLMEELKSLKISRCTTIRPTAARPHLLCPTHTYFLS
jgi:hypothetical protein